MKKTTLFIILGIILLIPAYSGADITDPSPVNFYWANINWDYRDFGNYGTLNWIGGSQLRKGSGFRFECEIRTGGLLDNINDVTRIKVYNIVTKKHYLLNYEPFLWPRYGGIMDYWALIIQPSEWMFESNWRFILYYKGSDGHNHKQFLLTTPPKKVFPADIAHVTINRAGGSFEVSWSGIGPPSQIINYRVLVFDGADVIEDFHGDWEGGGTLTTGTYDTNSNKVTFIIPAMYGGEAYGLRLANSTFMNRSLYYMTLPPF